MSIQVSEKQGLGDRMKQFEHTEHVDPTQGFLVRADGKSFSKFTKGLEKPFDLRFACAMMKTANDLLDFFQPKTVFVCSDEITLVFTPLEQLEQGDRSHHPENTRTHVFSGRRFKIETLVAAKASVCFNRHMQELVTDSSYPYPQGLLDRVARMDAIFDARLMIFNPDQLEEMVNNLIWRSVYECHRNTVSTFARHYLGTQTVFKKDSQEMISLMKEKGVDWSDDDVEYELGKNLPGKITKFYKFGSFSKKQQIELVNSDGETYQRTAVINFTVKLTSLDPKTRMEVLFGKYFLDDWKHLPGLTIFSCNSYH